MILIGKERPYVNTATPEFESCVAAIVSETGWPKEYVIQRLISCQTRFGIGIRDYFTMKLYLIPEENINSQYERIMRKRAKQNQARKVCIDKVTELTGCTAEEALQKIDACCQSYGIDYKDYKAIELWNISDEEKADICAAYLKKKKSEKRSRRLCISDAMNAMGWSEKLAVDLIEDCRKRLGVSYRDYQKLELYRLNEGEQFNAYRRLLKSRKRKEQELRTCIAAAVGAVGWTEEEASEKITSARKERGIPYYVYLELELWSKGPEEQDLLYKNYLAQKKAGEENTGSSTDAEE